MFTSRRGGQRHPPRAHDLQSTILCEAWNEGWRQRNRPPLLGEERRGRRGGREGEGSAAQWWAKRKKKGRGNEKAHDPQLVPSMCCTMGDIWAERQRCVGALDDPEITLNIWDGRGSHRTDWLPGSTDDPAAVENDELSVRALAHKVVWLSLIKNEHVCQNSYLRQHLTAQVQKQWGRDTGLI